MYLQGRLSWGQTKPCLMPEAMFQMLPPAPGDVLTSLAPWIRKGRVEWSRASNALVWPLSSPPAFLACCILLFSNPGNGRKRSSSWGYAGKTRLPVYLPPISCLRQPLQSYLWPDLAFQLEGGLREPQEMVTEVKSEQGTCLLPSSQS